MNQKTVWLNTHFNCITPIRQADTAGEFRIVTSYHSRKYNDVMLADLFELEPKLSDDEYVDYALDFIKRHGVDIFLPGRKMEQIARRIDEFKALGVIVILAGDADTLDLLENKGRFYDALGDNTVPVPPYAVASTAEEFAAAVTRLQAQLPVVCFKPTVGIFGYGFKILETADNALTLAGVDHHLVTNFDTALTSLSETQPFRQQIVLQYLEGEERSVDCLAHNGKLIRGVIRSKLADGSRVLENNPRIMEYTRRLVEKLGLTGLFNVQFKDLNGVPYVLEINARMSGGIAMSCLSGVSLPYWALKLALKDATEEDIPHGKTGLRVAELAQAVVLPAK